MKVCQSYLQHKINDDRTFFMISSICWRLLRLIYRLKHSLPAVYFSQSNRRLSIVWKRWLFDPDTAFQATRPSMPLRSHSTTRTWVYQLTNKGKFREIYWQFFLQRKMTREMFCRSTCSRALTFISFKISRHIIYNLRCKRYCNFATSIRD